MDHKGTALSLEYMRLRFERATTVEMKLMLAEQHFRNDLPEIIQLLKGEKEHGKPYD